MQVSISVDAPVQTVWDVLTDLDAASETIDAIVSIERLGGPEFGIGTRWRETRSMFGRTAAEEMEIVDVQAPTSYTVAAESHGARYRTVMSVTPEGAASVLSMSFEGEPTTMMARIVSKITGPLVNSAMRKALMADLADLKSAAEAR